MRRAQAWLVIAGAMAGLCGCELIVGNLSQCTVDTDCAADGPTVMCQNGLCVQDQRCTILGSSGPHAFVAGLIVDLTDPIGDGGFTPDSNGP
jgi:hypothetical protein